MLRRVGEGELPDLRPRLCGPARVQHHAQDAG
jgi:hypothetical protein